jgi:hypothetical protein
MNAIGNDKRDLVKAIYEQHWLHMRHVENQRLWFTNIFAILCGGSFALMRGGLFNKANWLIVGFLMVLSLLGLFVCLRIQMSLNGHRGAAELILSRYGLAHYSFKHKRNIILKLFRLSILFPAFFLFCFNFFLFVLLQIGFHNVWKSAPVPVLLFVAGTVALYFSKYDEPAPSNED